MKKYLVNSKLIWGGLASLSLMNISCQKHIKEEVKPNFLFVITDDQTYNSIHALGNSEIQTPNMDKLTQQGVVFTHCFNQGSWSGAVCLASRTMLLTGQTLYNAPRNEAYLPWIELKIKGKKDTVQTWGQTFTEAGYETFLTGKWHNTDLAALKSFNHAKAIGRGMYETFDENHSNKDAYNRSDNSKWKPWDKSKSGHWAPFVHDIIYDENGKAKIGARYTVNQHTSELYTDNAVDFLETTAKTTTKPFFMYVAFNAPHDPRQSPKKYVDMYERDKILVPRNFLPEHPFDQGDHYVRDEKLAPFPRTKAAVQLHRQEYYAIISHADNQIGRIMKALKNSGKADNTYVILTADHGLAIGSHGLMGKQSQYDHSVRMPFIIIGPGMEKGKRIDEMIYMQSVFATTCDLAGIKTPQTVQFPSISDLALGKTSNGEEYIYGGYKNLQRMIRSKTHKLILYPQVKKAQLFDLINDPDEMDNLISNKNSEQLIQSLFSKLVQKQQELGDTLVLNINDYKGICR